MWKILKRILVVTFAVLFGLFVAVFMLIRSYKKEIKETLLHEANKRIAGKVGFQDIHFSFFDTFPHISVTILKPFIQDSVSRTSIFEAEKLYFHVHLADIFSRNIHITSLYCNKAAFSLITDKNGRSNLEAIKSIEKQLEALKKKPATALTNVNKKNPDIWLKEIIFKQVSITIADTLRHKNIGFLFEDVTTAFERKTDTLDIKLKGNVFFNGLGFNTEKGSFLSQKHTTLDLHAALHIPKRHIYIYPSDLHTENQHIALNGAFDLAQKPGDFQLTFRNDKADLEACKSLLNTHLQGKLKRYKVREPLAVEVGLSGSLGRGDDPAVTARFSGKNITASMDTLVVKNAALQGEFTNQYNKAKQPADKNTVLSLNIASGMLQENLINANINIADFDNPDFTIKAVIQYRFNDQNKPLLKRFLSSNPELLTQLYKLKTDKPILADLQLKGRLLEENASPVVSLEGFLTDIDLQFENYRSRHTSARVFITNQSDNKLPASLKNTKVAIPYFQAQVQGANVTIHLTVTDFITPRIELSTAIKTSLQALTPWLPKGMPFSLQAGEALLKIDYNGGVINPGKNFTTLPGNLSGTITLEKAAIFYQPQQMSASSVNALLLLNNNDLIIKNLSGIMTGHHFEITGTLAHVVPYTFAPDDNDPLIDLKASMAITLKELNSRLKTEKYRFEKGKIGIQVAYKGFIKDYLQHTNEKIRSEISGSIAIDDAYFHYLPDDFQYSGFNGVLTFDENDVEIHNLNGFFNESPLQINGKARQLIPFFVQDDKQISADLQIHSSDLNLNKILRIKNRKKLSDPLLPVIKNPNYKEEDVFEKLNQALSPRRTFSQVFDQITDKIQTNIRLTADTAYYRNVTATQVMGELRLKPQLVEIINTGLHTADGILTMNGIIDMSSSKFDKMKFNVGLKRVDVQKIFSEFENFNQHTILDKNLRGTLEANISFDADLLPNLRIVSESMRGKMYIKLNNGQLLDFAPLGDVQKVIFKKRDFKNIRFATIENDFTLNGTEIEIKRMEIESSIMDLYIEGKYSFAENTDLSIQIPLKHILKRKKIFNPEVPDTTVFTGASVYLKAVSKNGKIHIAYDPFKKIRDNREKKRSQKMQTDSLVIRKEIFLKSPAKSVSRIRE